MASVLSNRNLAIATAALLAVVLVAVVRGASQFPGLPLLVQIHLASMIIIMGVTVPMLLGPKGTARHRLLGRIWAALMLGNALLTLCFNAGSRQLGGVFVGDFSPIHVISLFVAISVPQAVLKARRHDRAGHEGNIRGLVIGSLLVAGLFTLPFGRTLGEWLMGR
ncbi:DUF2306 domain-containing protein [Sandarakinorhabdus limnophila]|jgi:uncharacterized membrane protein|uniref:DUF2306 domain-containing protein n=1 Tax=Sandarakinorhabdus limnophila TaxID=210512 RepID=UPI002353E94E|nr:hypothetical protein [Sandarakinorhabdus limnophila]